MKRKICVVITARPSYSRVKTALEAIGRHSELELQLVLNASSMLDRYGNVSKVIRQDGFTPAAKLYTVVEGDLPLAMVKTTALCSLELASTFENIRPDIVVSVADRYETLGTAMTAAYMNLPLAHIQGGEVTGSIDEKVRHAITKLSDYHLVSTKKAAERVIKMGENPEFVFHTGCPSIDIAKSVAGCSLDFDPFTKYGGVGEKLDLSNGYIVGLQHPITTQHIEARQQVLETLHALEGLGLPVLWFWPNVDAGSDGTSSGIRWFRENTEAKNFHFFKNFEPEDFLKLISRSEVLVGNSSVAIREGSYLGVPAVNIGDRQDGRECGANIITVPHQREEIQAAIRKHISEKRRPSDLLYGDGHAGQKIADILARVPLQNTKKLHY